MKRQRGRGRGGKPGGGGGHHQGGGHPNRTMESSGPEIKVRGPAAHIYERYLQLARDATSSGDRVLGENYLQHADHYFRLLRQMQANLPQPQPMDRFGSDLDDEGDEEDTGAEAMEAGGEDQPEGEFAEQGGAPHQGQHGDRDGDRRRRGRRNRFRPEGGEGQSEAGEQRAEREPRTEREAREPRADRAPREPREGGEQRAERREREPREPREGGAEGFSNGPKPAFLRSE